MKKTFQIFISVTTLTLSILIFIVFLTDLNLRIPIFLSLSLLVFFLINLRYSHKFIKVFLTILIVLSTIYMISPFKVEIAKTEDQLKHFENEEQKIVVVPVLYGMVNHDDFSKIPEKGIILGGCIYSPPFSVEKVILIRGK